MLRSYQEIEDLKNRVVPSTTGKKKRAPPSHGKLRMTRDTFHLQEEDSEEEEFEEPKSVPRKISAKDNSLEDTSDEDSGDEFSTDYQKELVDKNKSVARMPTSRKLPTHKKKSSNEVRAVAKNKNKRSISTVDGKKKEVKKAKKARKTKKSANK